MVKVKYDLSIFEREFENERSILNEDYTQCIKVIYISCILSTNHSFVSLLQVYSFVRFWNLYKFHGLYYLSVYFYYVTGGNASITSCIVCQLFEAAVWVISEFPKYMIQFAEKIVWKLNLNQGQLISVLLILHSLTQRSSRGYSNSISSRFQTVLGVNTCHALKLHKLLMKTAFYFPVNLEE